MMVRKVPARRPNLWRVPRVPRACRMWLFTAAATLVADVVPGSKWAGVCNSFSPREHRLPPTIHAAITGASIIVTTVVNGSPDYAALLRLWLRSLDHYNVTRGGGAHQRTATLVGSLDARLDAAWDRGAFRSPATDGVAFWRSTLFPAAMKNTTFIGMMQRKGFLMSTLLGGGSRTSVLMIDLDMLWTGDVISILAPHRHDFECQTQQGMPHHDPYNTGIWFCTGTPRVQRFFACLGDILATHCKKYNALEQMCFTELLQHPKFALNVRAVHRRIFVKAHPGPLSVSDPRMAALHFPVYTHSAARLFSMYAAGAERQLPFIRPPDETPRYLRLGADTMAGDCLPKERNQPKLHTLALAVQLARLTNRTLLVPRAFTGEVEARFTQLINVHTLEEAYPDLQLRPANWNLVLPEYCRASRRGVSLVRKEKVDERVLASRFYTQQEYTSLATLKAYDPLYFEQFAIRSPTLDQVAERLRQPGSDAACMIEVDNLQFAQSEVSATSPPYACCVPHDVSGHHDCTATGPPAEPAVRVGARQRAASPRTSTRWHWL